MQTQIFITIRFWISGSVTKTLVLLLIACSNGSAQQKVVKVELYADNLYVHRPGPLSLTEIANDVFMRGEASEGPTITALNSLVNNIRSRGIVKKRQRFNRDNRVLVVLRYEDGSPGYISGNKWQYILYDGNVYKDKNHDLLVFVNAHFDVPSIRRYLEEIKIIEPNKENKL